jgi:hypothetical protein
MAEAIPAGEAPRASRLDRRKARTRQALIDDAVRLIAEGRGDRASIAEITEEADIGLRGVGIGMRGSGSGRGSCPYPLAAEASGERPRICGGSGLSGRVYRNSPEMRLIEPATMTTPNK